MLAEICPYDLTNTCEITVDAAQKETAYETLQSLADTDERFVSDTYEDFVAQWESVTSFISLAGYAFLIILGAIGVMNLVNTMINSVYTRKHELGILQAVLLAVTVAAVQLILTFAVTKSFRRTSLIERVRYSE